MAIKPGDLIEWVYKSNGQVVMTIPQTTTHTLKQSVTWKTYATEQRSFATAARSKT